MYPKSCIVVDLDETLITTDGRLMQGAMLFLTRIREIFEYVILWTYANEEHLINYLDKYQLHQYFDLKLCGSGTREGKLLSYVKKFLNTQLNVTSIGFCVLVDDRGANYSKDYDLFFKFDYKVHSYEYVFKIIVEQIQKWYKVPESVTYTIET
jgi:hypothetical protein